MSSDDNNNLTNIESVRYRKWLEEIFPEDGDYGIEREELVDGFVEQFSDLKEGSYEEKVHETWRQMRPFFQMVREANHGIIEMYILLALDKVVDAKKEVKTPRADAEIHRPDFTKPRKK